MTRRPFALGGLIGPAAFIAAWTILGARKAGYNPVEDHISRLAAQGVPQRPAMTAGFLVFGVSLPLYSVALRSRLDGYAWVTAATTGIATLAVAAFPLDGPAGDTAHAIAAGTGYATLAATPLLAAWPLHRLGRRGWSRASLIAGSVSAACLVATTIGPATGFFQRAGLTVGDAWIVASAVAILRGTFAAPAKPESN